MYDAIPMCVMCGHNEVQTVMNSEGEGYCSETCIRSAWEEAEDVPHYDDDGEPYCCSVDDDASALASAGWGTDEDYGYYGD